MKALLSVVGVLGLAVVFGLTEPVPASTQPVTLDDVRLVSEQVSNDDGPLGAKNGKTRGRGRRLRLCR